MATCISNVSKKNVETCENGDRKPVEVEIWREFIFWQDEYANIYVELYLDVRRGYSRVGKARVGTMKPIDIVMQNMDMLTEDEKMKIIYKFLWVMDETKTQFILGEIREHSRLSDKDVDKIATAVELICEV
jgi:hypothetical protein